MKPKIRDAEQADSLLVARFLKQDEDTPDDEKRRLASVWSWLFFENPHGRRKVVLGETSEGDLVGHIGCMPFQYRLGDQHLLAGFLCLLRVDEVQRNQLVFLRLVRKVLAEFKDAGFDLLYTLATRPRVIEGYLALGFERIGVVPVYAKPLQISAIVQRVVQDRLAIRIPTQALKPVDGLVSLLAPREPRGVEVRRASIDDLERLVAVAARATRAPIVATRTEAILRWRFFTSPRSEYEIHIAQTDSAPGGYIVLRPMPMKGLSTVAIVDWVFPPERPEIGTRLLLEADRAGRKHGASLIAILAVPSPDEARVLKRAGYLRSGQSFTLLVQGAPACVPRRLDDWSVSFFEHDFV